MTRNSGSTDMGNQAKQKRSVSSTLRYLNSSAHGMVPVLRTGRETYLWMPATSGGENVWRRVSTTGTSPGGARKRIALKAGSGMNSDLRLTRNSAQEPFKNSSSFRKLPSNGTSVNIGLARPELRSHLHLFSVSYPKRSFNIELKQPSRIEYPPDLAKPSFRQAWVFQIVRGR